MYTQMEYAMVHMHVAEADGPLSADQIGLAVGVAVPALHAALAALVANGEIVAEANPFGGNPLYRVNPE